MEKVIRIGRFTPDRGYEILITEKAEYSMESSLTDWRRDDNVRGTVEIYEDGIVFRSND